MKCPVCGSELKEGARFCEECGAKIPETAADDSNKKKTAKENKKENSKKESYVDNNGNITGTKVSENIWLCPDGKYRWYYEFPMLKNPTILITVWKVLGISFAVVYLMFFVFNLKDNIQYGWEDFGHFSMGLLLLFLFFLVLGVISYIILAAIYGWKYMVLFEMNDKEVSHIQMPKQFKKAEAIGWLTVLAGIASKSPAVAGLGLNVSARNSTTSVFKNVRRIKGSRRTHTIKVNQLLNHNQVYAADGDYDFVWKYITERCTDAKI